MTVDLPLAEMTLQEKLHTMERLWADLAQQAVDLPSPEWHTEVLQDRAQKVDSGELEFLDWKTAMAELREDVRDDTPA